MMHIEVIVNVIFSTMTMIGFLYIYKKTLLGMALVGGVLSYIELIYRTAMGSIPIVAYGLDLMLIPELIIMIYFTIYMYRDGFRWLPLIVIVLTINLILLLSTGHKLYGEVGTVFMLILLIWVSQSKHPCTINPWACKQKDIVSKDK